MGKRVNKGQIEVKRYLKVDDISASVEGVEDELGQVEFAFGHRLVQGLTATLLAEGGSPSGGSAGGTGAAAALGHGETGSAVGGAGTTVAGYLLKQPHFHKAQPHTPQFQFTKWEANRLGAWINEAFQAQVYLRMKEKGSKRAIGISAVFLNLTRRLNGFYEFVMTSLPTAFVPLLVIANSLFIAALWPRQMGRVQ